MSALLALFRTWVQKMEESAETAGGAFPAELLEKAKQAVRDELRCEEEAARASADALKQLARAMDDEQEEEDACEGAIRQKGSCACV